MYKLLLLLSGCAIIQNNFGQPQKTNNATRVVLLGTGTPVADPDRSGPSLAIIVNNVSYINVVYLRQE
jgi:hypothetical protein